jgi:diguanylate cyclase (GGDEF)-like protein/PAS domain S-box-containing protein
MGWSGTWRSRSLLDAPVVQQLLTASSPSERGAEWAADRRWPPAAGYPEPVLEVFPPETGVVGRVLRTGRAALVGEPAADPDFVASMPGAGGQVCVPIRAGQRVLGALSIETTGQGRLGASDLEILELLAGHLAVALENARLYRAARDELAERTRVASALRESEERYRHLVEQAQDILYRTDARGRFTYVNATGPRLTGYTTDELIGRHYLDLVHPDDRRWVARFYLGQARERRPSTYCEFRCRGRDGTTRWIGQHVRLLAEDGTILGFHAIARDITALKEAEAARQAAHQFVEQVIANAGEGIVVYDQALRYVVWNPAMERLTGLDAAEALGRSALELFPHLRAAGSDRLLERARACETVHTGDTPYQVPRTGRAGWTAATYTPHYDSAGTIDGVIGIIRDTTERKRMEDALAHQAWHDPLTGLPNRARFRDRLERALQDTDRAAGRVGVLFVDLDDFKVINDRLGHAAGDALLVEVASRLRTCLRTNDPAARPGGDEFTVLLDPLAGDREATLVAERIADELRTPIVLGGCELVVSASIGLALGRPGRDRAAQQVRRAGLALYRAKADGKARWAMFDASLEAQAAQLRPLGVERGQGHPFALPEATVESDTPLGTAPTAGGLPHAA